MACAMMPQAISEAVHTSPRPSTSRRPFGSAAALPPEQFESLLHLPQEDEWKLVAVGGVLGVALGAGQSWAFGALGLG